MSSVDNTSAPSATSLCNGASGANVFFASDVVADPTAPPIPRTGATNDFTFCSFATTTFSGATAAPPRENAAPESTSSARTASPISTSYRPISHVVPATIVPAHPVATRFPRMSHSSARAPFPRAITTPSTNVFADRCFPPPPAFRFAYSAEKHRRASPSPTSATRGSLHAHARARVASRASRAPRYGDTNARRATRIRGTDPSSFACGVVIRADSVVAGVVDPRRARASISSSYTRAAARRAGVGVATCGRRRVVRDARFESIDRRP